MMDAVKFIEERNRMCKSFDAGCTGCPAFNVCEDETCCVVDQESTLDATTQVAMVEAWSAAHPRKTRQSEFLKQWPDAMVYSDGVLDIYPCILEKARRCDKCNNGCTECRHEFWNQVVE